MSVHDLIDAIFSRPAEQGTSLAMVVMLRGDLVAEHYGMQPETIFGPASRVTSETPLISWSMAKSITHAAVGILVDDGLLDVDAPAAVPEWRGTDKESITLLDLLEMRPGLRFVEDYVDGDVSHCLAMLFGEGSDDHAAYVAALPLDHPPGIVWNYSSGTTNIICRIIGSVVGGGADGVDRFLRDRLFEPIGMHTATPRFDPAGTWVGSSYVYASGRDFATFGELYRNDGVAVSGTRVLPTGWAGHGRMFVAHDDTGAGRYGFDYGRHWWMWPEWPESIAAHGYEGQYIVVVPDRELTIVHLGKTAREQQPALVAALADLIESFPITGAAQRRVLRRRLAVHNGANDMTTETSSDASQAKTTTGELPIVEPSGAEPRRKFRLTLKLLLCFGVLYYFVVPLAPDFRDALSELRRVEPWLLALGLGLELMALFCYAPLMRAALGDAGSHLTLGRLFRIQMSTRALSSIVPGGSAASSALGYRLMTLSGVPGPDAGFALATVGLGSAVVLNLILWVALMVSIPIRGVNPLYGSVAMIGVIVMMFCAALVFGLMDGSGRAERVVRWIARKVHVNEDRASIVLARIAERLEQLLFDRRMLARVGLWATLNWLLDAAALWVFLRAFNVTMEIDALIIAFGIANLLAAIPITPGGLGYVDTGYIGMLAGFGAPAGQAALGVAAYRFAQFFFPILLGGVMYLSLRVGPWSIPRHERLMRLRDLAEEETRRGETNIDFQLRFPTRDDTGELIRRPPAPQTEHHKSRFWGWWRKDDTP